jgi:hypothetical protein
VAGSVGWRMGTGGGSDGRRGPCSPSVSSAEGGHQLCDTPLPPSASGSAPPPMFRHPMDHDHRTTGARHGARPTRRIVAPIAALVARRSVRPGAVVRPDRDDRAPAARRPAPGVGRHARRARRRADGLDGAPTGGCRRSGDDPRAVVAPVPDSAHSAAAGAGRLATATRGGRGPSVARHRAAPLVPGGVAPARSVLVARAAGSPRSLRLHDRGRQRPEGAERRAARRAGARTSRTNRARCLRGAGVGATAAARPYPRRGAERLVPGVDVSQ